MLEPRSADRSWLAAHFGTNRGAHVYGLADLDDHYWHRSRWWRSGRATIGEIGLSDEPNDRIVYGINLEEPETAIELWLALDRELPDRYFATGPLGFPDALEANGRTIEARYGEQIKMQLPADAMRQVDESSSTVDRLSTVDLDAIADLQSRRGDSSAYFVPELLDVGPHVGIREGDRLLAMAGVHACSTRSGVAAIGNVLVDPSARGAGLGRAVTLAMINELRHLGVTTIGLNVAVGNGPARAVYRRLGFQPVHRFTEALVAR